MKRREFITFLSGAAIVWPIIASAQQMERIRTVGILPGGTDNPEMRRLLGAFMESVKALGWTENRNVHFDVRWSGVNPENNAVQAQDLVRQQPDVIFAAPSNVVIALQKQTRTNLLYSQTCPTQLHRELSTTWRARPEISPVSATSNNRWWANGCNPQRGCTGA